jgi:hypothetical protein
MATTVYEIETVELQDGTEVTLRPLNIKRQRKFMLRFNKGVQGVKETLEASSVASDEKDDQKALDLMQKQETDWIDTLVACAIICLESELEQLQGTAKAATEYAEDVLDTQTISKILKVCAGINLEADLTELKAAATAVDQIGTT